MKPKTIKTTYWILTVIFCLMLIFDAIGGLIMAQEGQDALNHLHISVYLMPLFGVAKLLAVVALLQNRFARIKEWAFAGLAFNFIGAAWANAAIDGMNGFVFLPVIVLAFMFLIYYFWKRYNQTDRHFAATQLTSLL